MPIVAAFVSVVISVGSILIATREPEVYLVLPDHIRLVQGPNFPYLYFQPTFVNTSPTARVEVIPTMRLTVQPPSGPRSSSSGTRSAPGDMRITR